MNGGDAGGMRFNLPDLFRHQFAQTEQTVGVASLPEIFQTGQFALMGGNDNLAALFMGHPVFPAKRNHLLQATDTQSRLLRTRLVVKTGVEHAAVVAGLVSRQFRFFFEQQDPRFQTRFQKPGSRGQPHNASPYNDYVVVHHRLL